MILSYNATGAGKSNCLPEYMTMSSISSRKVLPFLALGWCDGYSFVPGGFNLLSSATKSNRYQEITEDIDCRSNGYKARKESLMAKTDAAILLIERALNAGIRADYVLMDTWFTTEHMIKSILSMGLDVIGMVKQLNQRYIYKGKAYIFHVL